MTDQETFDEVARHLLTQMERSEGYDGDDTEKFCMYRGERGLKCAIGALIPDHEYRRAMEDHSARWLVMKFPRLREHVCANTELLIDLQTVHDTHPPSMWADELRSLAYRHDLNSHVIDEVELARLVTEVK